MTLTFVKCQSSMSKTSLPSGYVKSVLQNGVGRYVCQLQRLTLQFCKTFANCRGMRDFIEKDLVEFTKAHPGVVVYLRPKRHGAALLKAEYLNGNTVEQLVNNKPREEICHWVEHFRSRSGQQIVPLLKLWHTDNPSIQGPWTPFTNKDSRMNLADFPDTNMSEVPHQIKTATDILLERARTLRLEDKESPK